MNLQKIELAEAEANRFLAKVESVRERAKTNKYWLFGCKETASLKRQSMELSNALSELRKSN